MPSSCSQSAVEAGACVAAPGSLIASGRTVTRAVDGLRADDDGAGEAVPVMGGPAMEGPAMGVLTAAVLTAAEAATAAAVAAVMRAARRILAPFRQAPLGHQEPLDLGEP